MRAILQRISAYTVKMLPGKGARHPKLRIGEDRLFLYPGSSHSPHKAGADDHLLYIDLGCALENALVAANALGYRGQVSLHFGDGEDYVELAVEPAGPPVNENFLEALENLRENPAAYREQSISADHISELVLACREPDVFLRVYDTPEERASLLPFVEEAVRLHHQDRGLRKELSSWLRLNGASVAAQNGVPSDQSGEAPRVAGWIKRFYLDRLLSAEGEQLQWRTLVENSAALLLFTTLHHNKEGWVNLGRSYQRVVLKAATMGISHSPVNMVCEEPVVRVQLKESLGYTPEEPLLLVRLGYAKEAAAGELLAEEDVSGSMSQ